MIRKLSGISWLSVAISAMAGGSAFAQETTLEIGLAGQSPSHDIQGITVSTAQIDAAIRNLPIPPQIPVVPENNVTRDLANDIFFDHVRDTVLSVKEDLAGVISFNGDVTIVSDKLVSKIYQPNNQLGASVGPVSFSGAAKLDVFGIGAFATAQVDIRNVRSDMTFNIYTGRFEAINFNFSVECDFGLDIPFLGGFIESIICGVFENAVAGAKSAINAEFEDFINEVHLGGVEYLLGEATEAVLGVSIPPQLAPYVTEAERQKVLATISYVDMLFSNGQLPATGLQLNLIVDLRPDQVISLVVSHLDPEVWSGQYTDYMAPVNVIAPAHTLSTKLYAGISPTIDGGNWSQIDEHYLGFSGVTYVDLAANLYFTAVSQSAVFPGLYSLPSNPVGFEIPEVPTGVCGTCGWNGYISPTIGGE